MSTKFPPIDKATETALIERLPDASAAEALVLGTMQSAIRYMCRVSRGTKTELELVSLAYSALSKSVRNVKPGKSSFMAYSKIYLRSAIFSDWKSQRVVPNTNKDAVVNFEALQSAKENFVSKIAEPRCQSLGLDAQEFEPGTEGHPIADFDFEGIDAREKGVEIDEAARRVCSDHERIVLQLRFKGDYSYQEIATFLGGITRSAVQAAAERALRKLRAALPARN